MTCEHCGELISQCRVGVVWLHTADNLMSCGQFRTTNARPLTCRIHGFVQEDHFPCRRPGESGMEFTSRVLGDMRDV